MHGNTDFASTRFRSGASHGARADAGADGVVTSCLRPLQQGLQSDEARDAQSELPGARESLGDALSAHFGGLEARHARCRQEPLGSLPLVRVPSSRLPLSGRGNLVRWPD